MAETPSSFPSAGFFPQCKNSKHTLQIQKLYLVTLKKHFKLVGVSPHKSFKHSHDSRVTQTGIFAAQVQVI